MKPYPLTLALASALFLCSQMNTRADFWEKLGIKKTTTNQVASSGLDLSSLSQDQVVSGLKEALGQGVQQAVSSLGKTNGFFTNINVRIPMPEQMLTVEKAMRALKQDKLADDFVLTMNRAAEQAVPVAANVFADALKQMTVEDAKTVLTGSDDAATQYFRRVTQTNLMARFLPIVQTATASNNVTASYKKLIGQAGNYSGTSTTNGTSSTLGGLLKTGSQYLSKNSVDVDTYVTEKALDGLFKMVAQEEKLIRENPKARTTELMEKVFGALQKQKK